MIAPQLGFKDAALFFRVQLPCSNRSVFDRKIAAILRGMRSSPEIEARPNRYLKYGGASDVAAQAN